MLSSRLLVKSVDALSCVALLLFACAITTAMPAAAASALTGPLWAWQYTLSPDNVRVVAKAPERYTLQFMPDGAVRLRADCNRGGGRYSSAGDRSLTFGPFATTKMACPGGTQDTAFLKALATIGSYRFEGADLVLSSADGTLSMRFKPTGS